jgi:hypothetical protein
MHQSIPNVQALRPDNNLKIKGLRQNEKIQQDMIFLRETFILQQPFYFRRQMSYKIITKVPAVIKRMPMSFLMANGS